MTVLKKIGKVIKESNSENENNKEIVPVEIESEDDNIQTNLRALPNSSIFSNLMTKTLGSLKSSPNSLKITASSSGPEILGVRIYNLGGDKLRISNTDYELTPEIHKALSSTGYTGNNMKNEIDILMLNNIINDSG